MAKTPAAKKPAAKPEAPTLAADVREQVLAAALAARENNLSTEFMDAENRHWFVGVETVSNNSNVLIQAKRGQDIREVYLSTATFTPELVDQAITAIHGALQ